MTDDLFDAPAGPRPGAAPPRKCYRHQWWLRVQVDGPTLAECSRCGKPRDPIVSRRSRNNGKRGRSDELRVARILGGNKLGQLGLPWDCEVPGFLRVQCKKLDAWPSVNAVVKWLDAIPSGRELRGVTLADAPGPGGKTRRLIVLDLDEFAAWFGGVR